MFYIDLKSRKALYEQVVDNFKKLITTGAFKENDKVPSVRDLARTLDINPNTVQKAYRELESQGYFYTVRGQGNFISPPPAESDSKEIQSKLAVLKGTARELIYRGFTKQRIVNYIDTEIEDGQRKGGEYDKN